MARDAERLAERAHGRKGALVSAAPHSHAARAAATASASRWPLRCAVNAATGRPYAAGSRLRTARGCGGCRQFQNFVRDGVPTINAARHRRVDGSDCSAARARRAPRSSWLRPPPGCGWRERLLHQRVQPRVVVEAPPRVRRTPPIRPQRSRTPAAPRHSCQAGACIRTDTAACGQRAARRSGACSARSWRIGPRARNSGMADADPRARRCERPRSQRHGVSARCDDPSSTPAWWRPRAPHCQQQFPRLRRDGVPARVVRAPRPPRRRSSPAADGGVAHWHVLRQVRAI